MAKRTGRRSCEGIPARTRSSNRHVVFVARRASFVVAAQEQVTANSLILGEEHRRHPDPPTTRLFSMSSAGRNDVGSKPTKRPIVLPRRTSSNSATPQSAPEAGPSETYIAPHQASSVASTSRPAAQASALPTSARPIVMHPSSNTIVINPCQKGNPIINHIRNVAYEWGDILSDYQVGATTGVLFLSYALHG